MNPHLVKLVDQRKGSWWVSYVIYDTATQGLDIKNGLIRGRTVRVHPLKWLSRMRKKLKRAHIELLAWQEIDQAEDEYAFAKFGKW